MEDEITVHISFSAMEMIEEIYRYKAEYNKTSAHEYVEGILEKIQRLQNYPESCAPCRNLKLQQKGYRCCLYKKHIIIYFLEKNKIKILAVIYSRRNPDGMDI